MRASALIGLCFLPLLGACTDESELGDSTALHYSISEKQDISFAGKERMTYRVVLHGDAIPVEGDVRQVVTVVWEDGNKHWDEFTVFLYLENTDIWSAAYAVAEFNPSGLQEFLINDFALYGTKWRSLEDERAEADQRWLSEKRAEGVNEYDITLDLSVADRHQLAITVGTNFPDGTNLLVDVGRIYYQVGEADSYFGGIFSKDIPVKNGKIEIAVTVEDGPWYQEYLSNKKEFESLGIFPDIKSISDEVEVSVLFSPRREQPSRILEILGENAENVRGNGAERVGSFTVYSASKTIGIPFQQ